VLFVGVWATLMVARKPHDAWGCWDNFFERLLTFVFPICLKLLAKNQLFPEIFFFVTSEFEQILEWILK
jgi:hypothetical protein